MVLNNCHRLGNLANDLEGRGHLSIFSVFSFRGISNLNNPAISNQTITANRIPPTANRQKRQADRGPRKAENWQGWFDDIITGSLKRFEDYASCLCEERSDEAISGSGIARVAFSNSAMIPCVISESLNRNGFGVKNPAKNKTISRLQITRNVFARSEATKQSPIRGLPRLRLAMTPYIILQSSNLIYGGKNI
jgi:hypothetical protein